jgi:hypothetical protein
MTSRPRGRSDLGLTLAGVVVIAGGIAVGVVEWLKLPKGSVWIVVAVTAGLVAAIRSLFRRR